MMTEQIESGVIRFGTSYRDGRAEESKPPAP
jgi:hypothetical protein